MSREVVTECICGQMPELTPLQRACEDCDAEPGEECRPMCIGQAAHLDAIGVDLTADETAPTYQVATATGVSRPAFSPSGQLWEWTPEGVTDYPSLSEAIAAAEAIPAADGLLVQLCRYPAPDPQTAPCIAQRIGRNAWRHDGRDLTSLAELVGAAPQ
jgi:hypothetical protein